MTRDEITELLRRAEYEVDADAVAAAVVARLLAYRAARDSEHVLVAGEGVVGALERHP